MHYDVGIIGGGVIGLTCAWRLAQAGARVVVFERGKVGREASWAAAGMLAAQCEMAHHPPSAKNDPARAAMFDLCLQSRAMYSAFADELFDITGIDVELSLSTHARGDWRTPGIMYVATDEHDASLGALLAQRGYGLDADGSTFMNHKGAVWLPHEGQVDNRKLVEALEVASRQANVTIRESEPVQNLRIEAGHVTGIGTSQHKMMYACDKFLLCVGSWSSQINDLPETCVPHVRPIKGQMLCIQPQKPVVNHVVYSSHVYLVPRRDGRLLIGATMEDVGFHKNLTSMGMGQLWDAATALIPEIAHWPIIQEHWAGLRPATADGLPILGRTALENLYVATGHFRNGILLAPISGQLMADCILKGVAPSHAFRPERFARQAAESEPLCTSN